jgi:hypothetical protein
MGFEQGKFSSSTADVMLASSASPRLISPIEPALLAGKFPEKQRRAVDSLSTFRELWT